MINNFTASSESLSAEREGGLRLDRFASILKRRILLILGITTLATSAAVLKVIVDEPDYTSSVELLTPPSTLETEIISTLNPEALSNRSEAIEFAIDEAELKILTSPRVINPTVESLAAIYPDLSYKSLIENLNLSPNEAGNILTIQYKSNNPEKVLTVLEAVSAAYLEYSLRDRQNDIDRGIAFVDEQLPGVRSRVDELELELQNLRQSSNLIDPLVQGEQLSAQMAKFTADQLELSVLIRETEDLYQNLRSDLASGGEFASTSALLESERYQALLNQILEVDSQLADELTLYLDDSPEIAVIEELRSNLQPLIQREGIRVQAQVESYIQELRARDQALVRAIETLNQRIKTLSTVAREYSDIQRELDIATTNLNQFLNKREALRIDSAQRQTPWELLTPPTELRSSASSIAQTTVIGIILGLSLGSLTAIALESLSGKVYSVAELKDVLPVPLMGIVPYEKALARGSYLQPFELSNGTVKNVAPFDSKQTVDFLQDVPPSFREAFVSLATNIRSNHPDKVIKSLAVSSAIADEGKSSISFYLACANALMGKRTLLVDADFRNPSLASLCNIPGTEGLSDYIAGDSSLQQIILKLDTGKNLSLVPAGTANIAPTKALSSSEMKLFCQEIYKEFDVVIFDTPPLLGFADAFITAENTQGLLLTSRIGSTRVSNLQAIFDELQTAKVPILGMVANCSKEATHNYYRYEAYRMKVQNTNGVSPRPSGLIAQKRRS